MNIDKAFNIFSLNHATVWFMLGFWIPHRYDWVIILSVFWEFLEVYAVHQPTLYALLKEYWIIPEEYWNEPIENKITDFGFNLIGYTLASEWVKIYAKDIRPFYIAFFIFICTVIYAAQRKV